MYQAGRPAEIGSQVTMNLLICNGLMPKLMDSLMTPAKAKNSRFFRHAS
jgi:hypothetical protein